MPERAPTVLEHAMAQVKGGQAQLALVVVALGEADVVVPSRTPVQSDWNQLTPLVFETSGGEQLALFTHPDRMAEFREVAKYAMIAPAREFFAATRDGFGIVINPGHETQMQLPAALVTQVRQLVVGGVDAGASAAPTPDAPDADAD